MNKIAEKGTEGGEKNARSEQSEDAMGGRDEEEASGKGPRDRFKSIGIVTALRIVTGVIDWKIAERGEKGAATRTPAARGSSGAAWPTLVSLDSVW